MYHRLYHCHRVSCAPFFKARCFSFHKSQIPANISIRHRMIQQRQLSAETLKIDKGKTSEYRSSIYFIVFISVGTLVFNVVYLKFYHKPPVYRLEADKFHPFKLAEVFPLNHDTSLLRFEAYIPEAVVNSIPIPSHVVIKDDSCQISREYSPITYTRDSLDILVKKYDEGHMSSLLHNLTVGDELSIRGPIWSFPYVENMADEIGMIAGGTGITPVYQLIKAILRNPEDDTKINLVYANKTEKDILLYNELQVLEKSYPGRLQVHYTVDKKTDGNWKQSVGSINEKMLKNWLPDPKNPRSLVLVCGPEGMVEKLGGRKVSNNDQGPLSGILQKLGYTERNVFKF